MTSAKFDIGDAVETDGGHYGRVVAIFADGIFAKRFCDCYYCNKSRKIDGYTERLVATEERVYLIETMRGVSAMAKESEMNAIPERALSSASSLRKYCSGFALDGSRRNGRIMF